MFNTGPAVTFCRPADARNPAQVVYLLHAPSSVMAGSAVVQCTSRVVGTERCFRAEGRCEQQQRQGGGRVNLAGKAGLSLRRLDLAEPHKDGAIAKAQRIGFV